MNVKEMLIELLEKNGPMTRDQLCNEFGFEKYPYHYNQIYMRGRTLTKYPRNYKQFHSRTTLYDNLKILRDQGKVERFSKNNGRKGRPHTFWKLIENEEM